LESATKHQTFPALRIDKLVHVDESWLFEQIAPIHNATAKQSFEAAIACRTIRLAVPVSADCTQLEAASQMESSPKGSMLSFVDDERLPDEDLPWMVYKHVKTGSREPEDSFLRFSRNQEVASLGVRGTELWPGQVSASLMQFMQWY
jgi:hypothetical protein